MLYSYKAINTSGTIEEGALEASDKREAARVLVTQGLKLLHLEEEKESAIKKIKRKILTRPIDDKTVALFCRQLSVLLETEPLHKILFILEEECKNNAYARVLREIRNDVEEGKPFYKALAKHDESFAKSTVSLIRAGEESGELRETLERLANYLEKIADAKEKFKGAMIYPTLLLCVTFGLIFLMFSFVIPTFATLFQSMNAELPALTKAVIELGDFVSRNGFFILLCFIFICLIFLYLLQYENFKYQLDKLMLRLPIWGDFTRHSAWQKICVTLAMLIRGGFSLDKALEATKDVSDNLVIKNFLYGASKKFTEGYSLTAAFRDFRDIPSVHFQLITAGEKSGRLEEVLLKAAEFSDKETGYILKKFESLTAPVLTLIVGGIVLLFVLSVALPIFSLTEIF